MRALRIWAHRFAFSAPPAKSHLCLCTKEWEMLRRTERNMCQLPSGGR